MGEHDDRREYVLGLLLATGFAAITIITIFVIAFITHTARC